MKYDHPEIERSAETSLIPANMHGYTLSLRGLSELTMKATPNLITHNGVPNDCPALFAELAEYGYFLKIDEGTAQEAGAE